MLMAWIYVCEPVCLPHQNDVSGLHCYLRLGVVWVWAAAEGSEVLLQLGSELISMACVTPEDHVDVHGLCCSLKPRSCSCWWLVLPLGPWWYPGLCYCWGPSLGPWSYCSWVCVDVCDRVTTKGHIDVCGLCVAWSHVDVWGLCLWWSWLCLDQWCCQEPCLGPWSYCCLVYVFLSVASVAIKS